MKNIKSFLYYYAVFVIVVCAASYLFNGGADGKIEDFIKVLAVGLTLLAAIMSSVVALDVAAKQRKSVQDIEVIKNKLSQDLERAKTILSGQSKAYEVMNIAASLYYNAVANLQNGTWDEEETQGAEMEMRRANGYTSLLPNNHKQSWYDFYQAGKFLIREMQTKALSTDEQIELWKKPENTIAEKYTAFNSTFREALKINDASE